MGREISNGRNSQIYYSEAREYMHLSFQISEKSEFISDFRLKVFMDTAVTDRL